MTTPQTIIDTLAMIGVHISRETAERVLAESQRKTDGKRRLA